MARLPRIQYPGAWYHVYNRGADKQVIFTDDGDRLSFVALLGEMLERHHVETHAWCLMDNHYHLLLHTPDGNLAEGMARLNGRYTQRFNARHERDGALLRGRYGTTLIERDEVLMWVARYIHRNPVEAGLVSSPQQWRWSSHRNYLDPSTAPEWLIRSQVMAAFANSRTRLHQFMSDPADDDLARALGRDQPPRILGSKAFIDEIEGQRCSPRPRDEAQLDSTQFAPQRRSNVAVADELVVDLDALDQAVVAAFHCDVADLAAGRKGRPNPARMAAAFLSIQAGGCGRAGAAARYGYESLGGLDAAVRRTEQDLETNAALAAKLRRIVTATQTDAREHRR